MIGLMADLNFGWLIDWMIDRTLSWLIDWLIVSLTRRLSTEVNLPLELRIALPYLACLPPRQGHRSTGAMEGQRPSCPWRAGAWAQVPLLCCLFINFFHIFFLHSLVSQAWPPFTLRNSWPATQCPFQNVAESKLRQTRFSQQRNSYKVNCPIF